MTLRRSRLHALVFRALSRIYPAWFRNEHGPEMEQLFLSRLTRAKGLRAVLVLWARVAGDATSTALALRRRRSALQPQPGNRGGTSMFWQDVRFGLRHLVRTPVFTAGALALLAVGIGANVAVFTIVDRFLLRSPPYAQPASVVYVYQDSDDGEPSSCSFPAYRDMAAADVFRAVAATSPARMTWERSGGDLSTVVEFTTASYLDVIGLKPLRGRWFSREHDTVGSQAVAVVSAATWRSRFGRDPGVVGRVIHLNGYPVTIIGVGPDGFSGTLAPVVTDFWLSISATVAAGQFRVANLERREDHWYSVLARLRSGAGVAQARAAMAALAARLAETYPDLNRGRNITVRRATDVHLYEQGSSVLLLASAIVVTLLLLASANLANLLLVRGIGRSTEMAIRRALGAGRLRIARLHLVESLALAAAGGLGGILLARLALTLLPLAPLPSPFSDTMDLSIDGRIAVFAIALMLATGVLFGLAPALRSIRENVALALRDDRRTSSVERTTLRLRNGLVVVQVAGSFVLVLAAGLLARSLVAAQHVPAGVDAEHVAYVRTSFTRTGLDDAAAAATLEQVRTRIEALPGVTHAAAASRLPAQFSGTTTTIVEGYTPSAGTDAVELNFTVVTPQYFDTVGLPILQGRGFTPSDVVGANRVVIVNQAAARRFWQGAAVGRRLRSQGQPGVFRTVVGVAADAPVATFPEQPVRPMFYVPSGQATLGSAYVLARTAGNAGALPPAMRSAVAEVRSSLPVLEQGTLASHFGDVLAGQRFMASVMGTVSALALVLASLGIYGVVAFNVARRTGELGIRVALGADPGRVTGMVVRETLGPVVVGLAGGLGLAALAAGQLKSVLFGVQPLDPLTLAGSVALLAAVAWLAAWLPARRAASADPARALRAS